MIGLSGDIVTFLVMTMVPVALKKAICILCHLRVLYFSRRGLLEGEGGVGREIGGVPD